MQPLLTFHNIRLNAETTIHVGTDSTTPAGTFYATTKYFDVLTTYLLAGDEWADDAPILGRIEFQGTITAPSRVAYAGNGLKGGYYLGSGSDEDVFASM